MLEPTELSGHLAQLVPTIDSSSEGPGFNSRFGNFKNFQIGTSNWEHGGRIRNLVPIGTHKRGRWGHIDAVKPLGPTMSSLLLEPTELNGHLAQLVPTMSKWFRVRAHQFVSVCLTQNPRPPYFFLASLMWEKWQYGVLLAIV